MLTLSTTQKTKQTSQEANYRQTSGELPVFLKESNYLVLDNFSSQCKLLLVFYALLKIKPLHKNFKISLWLPEKACVCLRNLLILFIF